MVLATRSLWRMRRNLNTWMRWACFKKYSPILESERLSGRVKSSKWMTTLMLDDVVLSNTCCSRTCTLQPPRGFPSLLFYPPAHWGLPPSTSPRRVARFPHKSSIRGSFHVQEQDNNILLVELKLTKPRQKPNVSHCNTTWILHWSIVIMWSGFV